MREPNDCRDQRRKERIAHRLQHEGGAVGVERRIEQALHAGQIEATVLGARVVAVDGECEASERGYQQGSGAAFVLRHGLRSPGGGELFFYWGNKCGQRLTAPSAAAGVAGTSKSDSMLNIKTLARRKRGRIAAPPGVGGW